MADDANERQTIIDMLEVGTIAERADRVAQLAKANVPAPLLLSTIRLLTHEKPDMTADHVVEWLMLSAKFAQTPAGRDVILAIIAPLRRDERAH
jgi:hypothetical protein